MSLRFALIAAALLGCEATGGGGTASSGTVKVAESGTKRGSAGGFATTLGQELGAPEGSLGAAAPGATTSAPPAGSNAAGTAPAAGSNAAGTAPAASSNTAGTAPAAGSNTAGTAPAAGSNAAGTAPAAGSNVAAGSAPAAGSSAGAGTTASAGSNAAAATGAMASGAVAATGSPAGAATGSAAPAKAAAGSTSAPAAGTTAAAPAAGAAVAGTPAAAKMAKRVYVKPAADVAAIKIELEPNWERDYGEAGTFSLVVNVPNSDDKRVFAVRYGYDDPSAPVDCDQYRKFLEDKKVMTPTLNRQRSGACYVESASAFRYMINYGGKRLMCQGSLYKDAASASLGDLRDKVLMQAKKICETLAL